MRTAIAIVLSLSACTSPPPDGSECLFVNVGLTWDGPAPFGTWNLEWSCSVHCDEPAPTLTHADRVVIGADRMTWWDGDDEIETVAARVVGGCVVTEPSANECRSRMRLCLMNGILRAEPLAFYDASTDLGQLWDMRGE